MSSVKTPCIGVCSTGIGDSVCRGCKRFSHEVIDWNGYSSDQKQAVFSRLCLLLSQVVKDKITIVDVSLLQQRIELQNINVNKELDPNCWVFDLLKAGASQIDDMKAYGFKARAQWQKLNAIQLRDKIDTEFYQLSCAHYQRYFFVG